MFIFGLFTNYHTWKVLFYFRIPSVVMIRRGPALGKLDLWKSQLNKILHSCDLTLSLKPILLQLMQQRLGFRGCTGDWNNGEPCRIGADNEAIGKAEPEFPVVFESGLKSPSSES